MHPTIICFLLVVSFLLVSCLPEKTETPTKGTIVLTIPESIEPAMRVQAEEFLKIYAVNGAHVDIQVGSTELAATRFVLDTARLAFLTRRLTPAEYDLVQNTAGQLIELAVAYDAVVAVVHYKNKTEQATLDDLRNILTGRTTRWEQLSTGGAMRGAITTIFQDSSDVSEYLRARLSLSTLKPRTAIRTSSSLQTLQRVMDSPGSIGFVGLDWLDSAKVPAKALELAQTQADVDTAFQPPVERIGKFYPPHPAHIHRNFYPFKRGIYMYSKSVRGDIATGFGTWVANKEGQKLFLARGIVPGTQPIRLR